MCMCVCICVCVYVFDIYSVLVYVFWFCLFFIFREELFKGIGWILFLLFEGSGNILIFFLLLKLILELRLLELEEIWWLFDIFELDFGIGWFILGLWFCIGCLSFSCKEIKLLIKKVCIVN